MMGLAERAEAVRARNKILESVPGSGFHDNDRDAHNRLAAPHMQHLPGGMAEGQPPLPRISTNLVAFDDRRQFILAGEDAVKALAALQTYHERIAQIRINLLTGSQAKLREEIPCLEIEDGKLVLWRDTWNDYLHAFDEQGVGISCLPLKE
jgi:hypothetical protein